jgi:hypothetical protein
VRDLGILDEHIEVAVLVKHAAVDELELGIVAGAASVLVDQRAIGELLLRILVEELHVGVRWSGVQVEVVLLDVLRMVAFIAGKTEEALLENAIAAVPKRDGEADVLVAVANAADAVFAPAIGARAGVVMREIAPSVAAAAVVLADRAPLALA